MNITELREHQIKFEKIKNEYQLEFKEIEKIRKKFLKDYTIENILKLKIDDYVIGKSNTSTFCSRIENELNNWGNIHGSTAIKFGLYYGKLGTDKSQKYRIGKKSFGSDTKTALENILKSIVELITNYQDFNILKKNPISPMLKGKILSLYYPDYFLNIYSAIHLNHFINCLGLDNFSKSELDKQALLMDFKRNDSIMKKWSTYEFNKFLYISFDKPLISNKDINLPNELDEFILDDFPPIEKINIKNVNLITIKNTIQNPKNEKANKKIDYSKQSKNYKRIGDRGEQIVLKAEREYLEKNNRSDLVNKIQHISNKNDSAGYDILSFDLNGNEKLIEVKSTIYKISENTFYLTSNELQVAEKEENYFFYLVYDVGGYEPKIWSIRSIDLLNDENIEKEAITFKIKIKFE